MAGVVLTTPIMDAPSAVEPALGRGQVGVAFSGGGSRAMVAGIGSLRALGWLGLWDRIWGVSGVSGGAWLVVPWVWQPAQVTDSDLLGQFVADPGALQWWGEEPPTALDQLGPLELGRAATHMGELEMFGESVAIAEASGCPSDQLWVAILRKVLLQPYGLAPTDETEQPQRYFSWSAQTWRDQVQAHNPDDAELGLDRFELVHHRRPWPIIATGLAPQGGRRSILPVEVTPSSVGVAGWHPAAGPEGADLGGGMVAPFAFGSAAALRGRRARTVRAVRPERRFDLGSLAAFSSASYSELFASVQPWLDGLDPDIPYWPVRDWQHARNRTRRTVVTDGGSLEDTGIVPLLRRPGLERIVAFVNSETALDRDRVTGQVIVDGEVSTLFGLQPHKAGVPYTQYPVDPAAPLLDADDAPYRHNQVFRTDRFWQLAGALWQAQQAGGAAIVQQELRVLHNPFHGVSGGRSVQLLWIYLAENRSFTDRLSPLVRGMKLLDPELWDFPHYSTGLQMRLSPRQVNLLAALGSWNVASNADRIRHFMGG